jgi:hypothetical protein
MSFGFQSLIAVAVTVGVAVAWTMAMTVAGVIWQRRELREFMTSHAVTIPAPDAVQAEDARELAAR